MEVYVYNETNGDFYCHHDYILEAPPLCIEPIFYDPGNDTDGKGNLVAVGTMESEIHIWDLDIVNSCTPFLTFPLNLGSLHSAAFNPEVGTVLAAGGSEGDLLRLIDLTKHEAIVQSFQ